MLSYRILSVRMNWIAIMLLTLVAGPQWVSGQPESNKSATPGAWVKTVYPSTDRIPVNVLRFYIDFSEPIREENALTHIRVMTSNGTELTSVFFDTNDELWNADRTKLTLLVDPGRVKSGLQAHNQLGRALTEGGTYTLSVDSLFRTMRGYRLSAGFAKTFLAVAADTIAPEIKTWVIRRPPAASRQALTIRFNEPIDHVSARSYLVLLNARGEKVPGSPVLNEHESVWSFTPVAKWQKGRYTLYVNTRLEDIAANNLNGAFDHVKGSLRSPREGETEKLVIDIP